MESAFKEDGTVDMDLLLAMQVHNADVAEIARSEAMQHTQMQQTQHEAQLQIQQQQIYQQMQQQNQSGLSPLSEEDLREQQAIYRRLQAEQVEREKKSSESGCHVM